MQTTILQASQWVAGQAPGEPSVVGMVLPIAVMFAVVYFLMIRPQSKQQKDHQSFLSTLQKGQEVVTYGGIVGKVHSVTDAAVHIEIAKDVRIQVLKNYVYAVPASPAQVPAGKETEQKAVEAKK